MAESKITTSKNRIETLDVLRGFALAGILYAHMVIWYTGAALPPDVYTKYDSTADGIALGIFGALVFGKFFSVFSFLFGLGFYLHFRNKRSKPEYLKIYIWRLFLLFFIGLLHHILWRGDILTIYAVLGIILLFFGKLSPKIILTIALLLITNIPTHLYDFFQTEVIRSSVALPMAEEAESYYSLVKNSGFFEVLEDNWRSWPAKIEYQLQSGRLFMTFGYFLLGLYAGRTKLFSDPENNLKTFISWNRASKNVVLILLFLALLMYLFNLVTIPGIKVVPELQWIASFLFSIYNACLSIFYITGITLLYRKGSFQKILRPLTALGRMALTIYIMQTLFGLLLFYNFGFGLFDQTSPSINVFMGVVVFLIQLKFAQWWLSRFQQGPVEWVWKSLTYFDFSSIKKSNK
ncbi:DUF418 domain-containing protein [Salinimicrobium sp. HB62]|uniref:DUF418 domain-containing protein n=1 Tax=Salinimicrobium sp. HB62 TaxID=3077781 RepID=UPI002D79ACD6|nr:DUF418 domain-containing protein [Salinimicrobium sp. HB62]